MNGCSSDVASLVLEDGSVFFGQSCGCPGKVCGEIVAVTSMTGYEKIITDPSYAGQIVLFTTSHIGVVGMQTREFESSAALIAGCIAQDVSFFCTDGGTKECLPSFFLQQGVVAICGVDTRALARLLTARGSMQGSIVAEGCDRILYRVLVVDFGVKKSILQALKLRGCLVDCIPPQHVERALRQRSYSGAVVSNGPYDPRDFDAEFIHFLLRKNIPLLGICLGHQLIAQAMGAKIIPLIQGHRSSNHPIIEVATNKVFISSQNHGFIVADDHLPAALHVSYRSLLDGSIEGLISPIYPLITLQSHPEGGPGPGQMSFIFDEFVSMMKGDYAEVF